MFEEPDGDHGECEEEGVEQQGEAVQLVELQKNIYYLQQKYLLPRDLQLLLVIGDVWRDGGAEPAGQLLVGDGRVLILHNYLVLVLSKVTLCDYSEIYHQARYIYHYL